MKDWRSRALLIAAALGLAGAIITLALDPRAFLAGYLTVVIAVGAIPIGALGVLMMTYSIRGVWTEGLHVPLTGAAALLPLTGLLFIPVLIGIPWLYPWANHSFDPDPGSFKAIYLSPWFFALRTVAYFVLWSAIALWVRRVWARPQEMVRAGSAGLIIYALTVSLAGVDWIETLTPKFHSSVYGLLFLTFAMLAGLAFGIVMVTLRQKRRRVWDGYGAILLTALLIWAYLHAMQYIIIWSGDIPEEVDWYLRRLSDGWGWLLWGFILLQFVLPFFALLSEQVRRGARPLAAVAGLTLALRLVESTLLVIPSAEVAGRLWLLALAACGLLVGTLGFLALRFTLAWVERSELDTRALPAPASAA
jgi:hypothetical protein